MRTGASKKEINLINEVEAALRGGAPLSDREKANEEWYLDALDRPRRPLTAPLLAEALRKVLR